jgi:hypothetical protein
LRVAEPGVIPERFEREYGCTETEWLRWLPGAVRDQPLSQAAAGQARVAIGGGELRLGWTALSPRQIAMIRMPRMTVTFAFDDVGDEARTDFMRYFDLYMQRGGG